jgi:CubicO group peptidase (beta-lactamase class C family)
MKRPGPDWSMVHGANGAGYQTAFNNAVASGFRPSIITATGPANGAVFAGVFEQGAGVPLTRFGLTSGSPTNANTIEHWHREAQNSGWIMISGAIYGSAAQPAYAGIWPENNQRVAWNAEGTQDDSAGYQQRFNAQTSAFARPAFVARSEWGRYLSIFRDDYIGPIVARHEMTFDELNAAFSQYFALGFFPISLQGGGSGAGIRFAAVFAMQDRALPRTFSASGPTAVAAIDDAARALLASTGIRGASVGVTTGRRLVYAQGYALAEPGYPTVLPTTPFRIASVSKTITAVAVEQLVEQNLVTLTDRLQNILQLTPPPGGAIDPGFANITIRELLEHRSGIGGGPSDEEVRATFNTILPVSGGLVARWVAARPLADPTKPVVYSNLGYWLLGLAVAARRGRTFIDALRQTIGIPLGLTTLRVAGPTLGTTFADEAPYHRLSMASENRPGLGVNRSVMSNDRPLVPIIYGDRNLLNEDASGGLSASAVDQARVLAALSMTTDSPILRATSVTAMLQRAVANLPNPAGRAGYGFDGAALTSGNYTADKGGYLFTSQNMLWLNRAGVSVAVCLNGTSAAQNMESVRAAAAATDWTHTPDLFPSFGMPSL